MLLVCTENLVMSRSVPAETLKKLPMDPFPLAKVVESSFVVTAGGDEGGRVGAGVGSGVGEYAPPLSEILTRA